MRVKFTVVLLASALALSGCPGNNSKETGGAVIGGATGAIIGSQFGHGSGSVVGAAVGAVAGILIGSSIGKSMDDQDRRLASQSAYEALDRAPDRQPVVWRNSRNNHHGTFVIIETVEEPTYHKVCRSYVHTVYIDGQPERVHGRACKYVRERNSDWYYE